MADVRWFYCQRRHTHARHKSHSIKPQITSRTHSHQTHQPNRAFQTHYRKFQIKRTNTRFLFSCSFYFGSERNFLSVIYCVRVITLLCHLYSAFVCARCDSVTSLTIVYVMEPRTQINAYNCSTWLPFRQLESVWCMRVYNVKSNSHTTKAIIIMHYEKWCQIEQRAVTLNKRAHYYPSFAGCGDFVFCIHNKHNPHNFRM